jgi:hypothetical protein
MNPTYKAHIESNLDTYRYQTLLQYLDCWKTPAPRKLDANELLTSYYGWEVRNLATQHLKNHLYQKVVDCGSLAAAIMFTSRHFIMMGENTKSLPACSTPIITGVLQELQGHINKSFGHQINVPIHEKLDGIIKQNTIL